MPAAPRTCHYRANVASAVQASLAFPCLGMAALVHSEIESEISTTHTTSFRKYQHKDIHQLVVNALQLVITIIFFILSGLSLSLKISSYLDVVAARAL